MRIKFRRYSCILLTLVLLLSGFGRIAPKEVSAETTEDGFEYAVLEDGTVEITGYVGEKTELVIPSENDGKKVTSIGDYAFDFCSSLTSIEIPSSVKSIGDNAFFRCDSLTSIRIPRGVTSVKEYTFGYCYNLRSIEIPDSVTSIEFGAFNGCESLTSIEIPDSVTSIGDVAFCCCESLTSIEIPDSVKYIGDGAFIGCEGLTSIAVASENSSYDSRENCNAIIETDWDTLIVGCKNTIIPNSVTSIGRCAFSGRRDLISIEIPSNVTSIGERVFANCYDLISIEIPSSVTHIGDGAFIGCEGLTSIAVASENSSYDSRENCNAIIEKNGDTLIVGCKNTIIPNSVRSIGDDAFSCCESLTSIEIPDSVRSIGSSAFYGCESLTSIEIPDSVTSIGDDAFSCCESLTSIEISCNVTSIGERVFEDCYDLISIKIPDSVTSIEYGAFSGCRDLISVEIPSSVTHIGNDAFNSCESLTSIEIPDSVRSIGDSAFYNCSSLKWIVIPNSVTSIDGDYVLSECPEDMIVYADADSVAATYAKEAGYTVKPIGEKNIICATGTVATSYKYDGEAKEPVGADISVQWQGESLTENVDYQIVSYQNNTAVGVAGVMLEGIGDYYGLLVIEFEIAKAEKPVNMPATSVSVAHSIEKVSACSLPEGWKWADADVSKTLTVGVPVQVTACYVGADKNCYEQTSVVITITRSKCEHKGNTYVRNVVEATCAATGYTGDTYCSICNELIQGGTAVAMLDHVWDTGVVVKPATTQNTGEMLHTCQVCKTTKTETIDKLPLPVKGEQRQDKDGKANYTVTKSVANNTEVAFAGVIINAKTITIPNEVILSDGTTAKVTSIAKSALKNNKKVTKLLIGNNVKTIGDDAFSGCTKLKAVVMGKHVTSIGTRAFKNCKTMASITLGTKVTTIDKEAFRGCSKLKTITFKSKKLKKVGKNAFKGIKSNAKIKVPSSKLKAYKKLLKGKGQGKKVKITK